MKVTAWNNGANSKTGSGYGFKISIEDRQKYFSEQWQTIDLLLPKLDKPISININKSSFWNKTCRELISQDIGKWLLSNDHAPWPKGMPPKFELLHVNNNVFRIE